MDLVEIGLWLSLLTNLQPLTMPLDTVTPLTPILLFLPFRDPLQSVNVNPQLSYHYAQWLSNVIFICI